MSPLIMKQETARLETNVRSKVTDSLAPLQVAAILRLRLRGLVRASYHYHLSNRKDGVGVAKG